MNSQNIRAGILAFVMAAACALAIAITPKVYLSDLYAREKLVDIIPQSFGDWVIDTSIVPLPPSPDVQKVIDATYDETVALTYRNADGDRIMLSLAYGRNQHKGMITHRPEICYPAQGFKLQTDVNNGSIALSDRQLPVKHLVAAMGTRNEPITYWVVVGNQVTEFGYPHRWVTIKYGLKGEIPDGVLVRVSSIDNDNTRAFKLQDGFVRDFLAAMPEGKRQRLLGGTHS
jgi:EpsI family protein